MHNLAADYPEISEVIKTEFFDNGSECDQFGCFEESDVNEIESQSRDGFIAHTNGGFRAMVMQLLNQDTSYMGKNETEIIQPYIDSALADCASDFVAHRSEDFPESVTDADDIPAALWDYFDQCETEHDTKRAQYPVDLLGDTIPPFWNTDAGELREDFYNYESEYMSEGGEYWLTFTAIFYAADHRRNETGKDEIYFFAGVNTDFTYGREKGLQTTFDRTYSIDRLTPNRIKVIVAAMRDSL